MANQPTNTLANPPLIESLIGVQFLPLAELDLAALLDFRQLIQQDFPIIEFAPYLDNAIEAFGAERPTGIFLPRIMLGPSSRPRLHMIDQSGVELVQLQDSRLIVNWRRTPDNTYSGFSKVRALFNQQWSRLQSFAADRLGVRIAPNQWEVTSVNHIEIGSIVQDRSDWNAALPSLFPPCAGPCPLEKVIGTWQFEFRDKPARLYVEIGHGLRSMNLSENLSDQEVITFQLTIRGPVRNSLDEDIEFGHGVLVDQFMSLTSDQAKQFWSKR